MAYAAVHRVVRCPFPREAVAEVLGAVADAAGRVVRLVRRVLPLVPGLAGAGLASWGAAQIYMPAGWILGGAFLLAADRQLGRARE